MSKTFRIFAAEFEKHHKYQRFRHYFMTAQTTTYQYFTTSLTSVGEISTR